MSKKQNPFQSFIVKATSKADVAPTSPPKHLLSPAPSSNADQNAKALGEDSNWVHYIDDESGFPYVYNTSTGEARWLTETEYQDYDQQAVVVVESPWETMYDNDGNMYYYNKETGISAWEIPAEDLVKYGLETLQNQDTGYYQEIGLDPMLGNQLSSKLSSMNLLEEALGESLGDGENDVINKNYNKSLTRNNSMKSVRSARSFGLKTPNKSSSMEELANQIANQLGSGGGSLKSAMSSSTKKKGAKTQLSFVLGSNRSFKVDDSLKPITPSNKKSKSGFEILKISSRVLRAGQDESGDVWLEYQSAEDGPLFYAKRGFEGGQWRIPTTFNVIDLDESQDLDIAPPYNPKKDDATITPSETSLEVVDFFSLDKDEVLKIQSLSLSKHDPNGSLKSESKQEASLKSSVGESTPKETSSTLKLPDIAGDIPTSTLAKPATSSEKISSPSIGLPIQPIAQLPQSNVELKIQSIKAEAALELEKLRMRLETVKQGAITPSPKSIELRNSISLSTPYPFTFASIKDPSPHSASALLKSADLVSNKNDSVSENQSVNLHIETTSLSAQQQPMENTTDAVDASLRDNSNTVTDTEVSSMAPVSLKEKSRIFSFKFAENTVPSTTSPSGSNIETVNNTGNIDSRDILPVHSMPLQQSVTPSTTISAISPSSTVATPPITSSVNTSPPTKFIIPKPSSDETPKTEEILWDEVLPRAHLLRTTLRWECYFDAQTKLKFFKRRSDGFLQKDKPYDFDTFNVSSHSLLGLAKNESNANTPLAPIIAEPTQVSFSSSVVDKEKTFESPKNLKKKQKKKDDMLSSSFLTGVNVAEKESDSSDDDAPKNISTTEDISKVIPTEVEEDVLEQMMRELAFVERYSSRAIRAIYHERQHLEQHDADKLTSRLETLAEKRLKMEESKRMRMTERYVAGMDTDQVKRLQARSKQLLERCYEIQEFIEPSPIEHSMIEDQILRSAILQREYLSFPLCMKHDQPLYHLAPQEILFPSSLGTLSYWRKQAHQTDKMGWLKLRSASTNLTDCVYYHSHSHTVQHSEPFDLFIRREMKEMKKENWGDYEVKVSINQSILENSGIELWEDGQGGYLFHCPMRGTFSSNGRFDPISFHMTTGRPNNFRRKTSVVEESWTQKLKPTIWKQLGLKKDEISNRVREVFATTNMDILFDKQNEQVLSSGNDRSRWTMATSDSSDNLQLASSASQEVASSMKKLKEKAQKNPSYFQETLQALEKLQEASNVQKQDEIANKRYVQVKSAQTTSILEEAFSVAQQVYDPSAMMATNEDAWKFEATPDDFTNIKSEDNDADKNASYSVPASHTIEALKYESRFDEETMQKYQQLLIFVYQDPENPGHLFNLMEFFLQQGLNKAALATLQRTVAVIQSYDSYKPGKYEQCLIQIMKSKLSIKCNNQFTSYQEILKMLNTFPDKPLVLTFVGAYFARIHHYDWAQIQYLGALMQFPSYDMALVKFAHLLFLQGDLKQASRYLQKTVLENENGLWARRSKMEVAWVLEMLGADDEALIVGYKALIGVNSRDSVQGKTLLALGNLYQRMRKFRLAFDFYQRALQVDRDFGLSSILFATAQSVQYVQNQVIPSSIPLICVENGGGYDTSVDAKAVDDMMTTKKINGKSSLSNRPPSANATHRSTMGINAISAPNKLARPKSAGAVRSKSHGKTHTLLSTSMSAFPPADNITNSALSKNVANATVSMVNIASKSLLSQLPPNKRASATIAAVDQSSKPLVSHVQNSAWKQTADALYRRGLVLIPDSSYHWISLLAYGDFIMAVMKDTKRALEYYEDAVKESFSTQIWPIVALGGAYQYVTNDLTAARRLYTRALLSRHPPTPLFMQSLAERQRNVNNANCDQKPTESQPCLLSSFRTFLKKKLKGDQSVLGSNSRLSSSTFHAQRTGKHTYGSRQIYWKNDDDEDDENDNDFDATQPNVMKASTDNLNRTEQFHLQREEALSLLQSATLSKVSEPADDPVLSPQMNSPGVSASHVSSSNYQRRMQDTANLVLQEKECQVLYIAIAFLLWDMHDLNGAFRYALAALKLCPHYAPALRCMGFLLFYIHDDRRLSFRYFTAAVDASFSSVSSIANGESNTGTISSSGTSNIQSIPLCHNLSALRTLAIVRAMRCQYDQAILGMERVLLQSTTCRFAHRSLAVWYYHVKQHTEKALQHLHSAWELSGYQDVEVLRWKAQILMDAQAFKEARVCLLECLRLAPFDGVCYANMAMCIYFMCRENHTEEVSQYEELRYAPKKMSEINDKKPALKQYTVEELEVIAHSKDIFQLFEIAKVISAENCAGSFAEFHRRRRQRRRHRQQQKEESSPTDNSATHHDNDFSQHNRNPFCHFLGGPTVHITGAYMDDDEDQTLSDAVSYFVDPHRDGKDTSSSLAYVHFLQGCLDLLIAPSLAEFGIDEEDACEDARTPALAQAKTSFSTAALYAQGCEQTSHHWYPLSLFHLGQIAEEELDLVTAERLYSEAIAVQNVHPIAFAQLQDCNSKLLKLHKDRLKELKRPYTKKGKTMRRGKQTLQESTFSDFHSDEKLSMALKSSSNGGSKRKKAGGKKDEGLEWMLRQSAQGKGLLDASMAQFIRTSLDANADAKKVGNSQEENLEAMGEKNENVNGSGHDNDCSNDVSVEDACDDEDDKSGEDRELLDDIPLAVQNRTMERCFKRVMVHTRIQEAVLLKKYQLSKQLKDVKLVFPNLSTYALPNRQINTRYKRKKSTLQVQLQMGVSMGALDMVKSFFYVDHDWLERCLYATAKCEDWATMLQCYYK